MSHEERVEMLFAEANRLGLCYPTAGMLCDLLSDIEFNALLNPKLTAESHGLVWKNGELKLGEISPISNEEDLSCMPMEN